MEFINGRAYKKEELLSSGKYKVLRVGNFFTNNSWYYSNLELTEDKYCYKGDLLYAWSASFGPKIWDGDKTIFHYHIWNVKYNHSVATRDYLFYFLLYDKNQISKSTTGSTMVHVSMENMKPRFIPLPPLKEQQRIVAEIEHWFTLINQIEQGNAELQTSIKQAKSKILDLAIHGKLVPQNPNDEPASKLLKRINPKAEITCDNGQYGKVPNGWCLATGASLFKQMKSTKPYGEVFKYIDIDSIDNKSNIIASIKRIPTIEAPSRASRYTEKGDVVFSMVRPYLKNIAQITEDNCIASTGFYICSPHNCMLPQFCYYMMLSNYVVDGLNGFMKGDNSPSITKGNIDNWLFPIPPLAEQKRIVDAIEKAFAKLDTIMESL